MTLETWLNGAPEGGIRFAQVWANKEIRGSVRVYLTVRPPKGDEIQVQGDGTTIQEAFDAAYKELVQWVI